MERLTKRCGNMCVTENFDYIYLWEMPNEAFKGFNEVVEKLAEYEDLEEQGLLVRLPCKIGDKVWDIAGKEIREQIVDGIEYRPDGFFIYANEDEWLGELGKLVFLTKAEAEKTLAEMEK